MGVCGSFYPDMFRHMAAILRGSWVPDKLLKQCSVIWACADLSTPTCFGIWLPYAETWRGWKIWNVLIKTSTTSLSICWCFTNGTTGCSVQPSIYCSPVALELSQKKLQISLTCEEFAEIWRFLQNEVEQRFTECAARVPRDTWPVPVGSVDIFLQCVRKVTVHLGYVT
jgi:hypothetical protein